jgi:hypothetical protein
VLLECRCLRICAEYLSHSHTHVCGCVWVFEILSNKPKANANMMQTPCKHLASIMLCFQSILGALHHLMGHF